MAVALELAQIRPRHDAARADLVLNSHRRVEITVRMEYLLHEPRHVVRAAARGAADDELDRPLGLPALRGRGQRHPGEQCPSDEDAQVLQRMSLFHETSPHASA